MAAMHEMRHDPPDNAGDNQAVDERNDQAD